MGKTQFHCNFARHGHLSPIPEYEQEPKDYLLRWHCRPRLPRGLIVVLIISNSKRTEEVNQAREETESLRLANDRLLLTNEFNQLNADFNQYEDQQIYLKNDSLVKKYNEARLKVEGLLNELDHEKKNNAQNRKRIK